MMVMSSHALHAMMVTVSWPQNNDSGGTTKVVIEEPEHVR